MCYIYTKADATWREEDIWMDGLKHEPWEQGHVESKIDGEDKTVGRCDVI